MTLTVKQIIGIVLLFLGVVTVSMVTLLGGSLILPGLGLIVVGAFLIVKRGAKPEVDGSVPYDNSGDED
jgi:drug/metabolite transporter (DMT)-like permease